jgi:hypothetical protein
MGTGSLLGVKRPRRGVDTPSPSSAKVKERVLVQLYLYSPSGPSWLVLGRTLLELLSLEAKWLEHDADHSPPSSAKVMNEWSCTPTPLIHLHGVDRDNLAF